MTNSLQQLERRRSRVRAKVTGSSQRPRLSVKITGRNIIAQVIDDSTGNTLAYATTVGQSLKGSMTEKSAQIGQQIAAAASGKGVKQVAFDRNGRIYHGRLHALAEAARQAGLEF